MRIYYRMLGAGVLVMLLVGLNSCVKKYLDIIPDNIAKIDNAFTMRIMAERFLFTCYSWLPNESDINNGPAMLTADELWAVDLPPAGYVGNGLKIAKGFQGIVDPYLNFWDGEGGGVPLFRGIRECNIFLENVGKVPDVDEVERGRWIGEVKFLKAYYHFLLLRMYGPVPIVDVNLPISVSVEDVKVERAAIDDCFDFIVRTIDEAVETLPDVITDKVTEKGRIDRCIAKALKARVLVYAASPLFNGNSEYSGFLNKAGQPYFNQQFDGHKWELAAEACQEAVRFCEANGFVLNRFIPSGTQSLSNSQINQLSYRDAMAERTNAEVIWANMKDVFGDGNTQQVRCLPRGILGGSGGGNGYIGVPLKMVEMFYTDHGVPLEEDKTRSIASRYDLRVVRPEESTNLVSGYLTADLNFDREDRYYGAVGFDGGKLFGMGRVTEATQWPLHMKYGQAGGIYTADSYVITGYFPKKMLNYQSVPNSTSMAARSYPWPILRLADLYLLCAEAINEAEGPTSEAIRMVDMVRERSGLNGVQQSWTSYSRRPDKFSTREGLRDIIRRERTIELMFEGQRAWDIRRWKTALVELNAPIRGWDTFKKTEAEYYTPVTLFNQKFFNKNYFWPIKEQSLQVNRNLDQNPGW